MPDAAVWYLTLILPEVNPVDAGNEVPVQAVAIRTEQRTSIGGPALVRGPLQLYDVVILEGTAEFAPGSARPTSTR